MLAFDFSKYIHSLAREYRLEERNTSPNWKRELPLVLTGPAGCGKTHAVQSYCNSSGHYFYFSFRNISSDLALKLFTLRYSNVLGECHDWGSFFERLRCHIGDIQHTVLVFDDWDERKIEEEFLFELRSMLKKQERRNLFAILITRKTPIKTECRCIEMVSMTPADIKRAFKNLSSEDVLRLYAVTNGYTGYISAYDTSKEFDANIKQFFDPKSHYFNCAEVQMKELFRSPESYSAILYALANGKYKLKEIAAFAGFSLNKCEKYLSSLLTEGVVCKEAVKSNDLRSCTKYDFRSSYLKLWSRFLLGESGNDEFFDSRSESIEDYIDSVLVPDVFRRECFRWAEKKKSSLLYPRRILMERSSNYDVKVGDMVFDFAQKGGERMIVMKIWTDKNICYGNKDFEKIVSETEKEVPFYNTEFYLFSIHRFSDSMWKKANRYENVHLVEARFLSGGR